MGISSNYSNGGTTSWRTCPAELFLRGTCSKAHRYGTGSPDLHKGGFLQGVTAHPRAATHHFTAWQMTTIPLQSVCIEGKNACKRQRWKAQTKGQIFISRCTLPFSAPLKFMRVSPQKAYIHNTEQIDPKAILVTLGKKKCKKHYTRSRGEGVGRNACEWKLTQQD